MANKDLTFCTTVVYHEGCNPSFSQRLRHTVDVCLPLGGKTVEVIQVETAADGTVQLTGSEIDAKLSFGQILLKIVVCATGILALIALAIKAVLSLCSKQVLIEKPQSLIPSPHTGSTETPQPVPEKTESTISAPPITPTPPAITTPTTPFSVFTIGNFPGMGGIGMPIMSEAELNKSFLSMTEQASKEHKWFELTVDNASPQTIDQLKGQFQQYPKQCSYKLAASSMKILISPPCQKRAKISQDQEKYTEERVFASDITEQVTCLNPEGWTGEGVPPPQKGERHFSSGIKEYGEFSYVGLRRGYRLIKDKPPEFINPMAVEMLLDSSQALYRTFLFIEFESSLIALEEIPHKSRDRDKAEYRILSPFETVERLIQTSEHRGWQDTEKLLKHPYFKNPIWGSAKSLQDLLIEHAVTIQPPLAHPNLFTYPIVLLKTLLEQCPEKILPYADKLFNDKSNLLLHLTVRWEESNEPHVFNRFLASVSCLAKLFPTQFSPLCREILMRGADKYLTNEKRPGLKEEFLKFVNALDVTHLDPFSRILRVILNGKEPESAIEKELASLPLDQQEQLDDIAFRCRNSFFTQPATVPVTPEQYAVHLWVRKEQMEASTGSLLTQQSISWLKEHAASGIDLWFDIEISDESIQKAETEVRAELGRLQIDGSRIRFNQKSALATSEHHVNFTKHIAKLTRDQDRSTLHKTVIADHLLHQTKQFIVFADIDVVSIPAQRLFDKRTVQALGDTGLVSAYRENTLQHFSNHLQIFNRVHPFAGLHTEMLKKVLSSTHGLHGVFKTFYIGIAIELLVRSNTFGTLSTTSRTDPVTLDLVSYMTFIKDKETTKVFFNDMMRIKIVRFQESPKRV